MSMRIGLLVCLVLSVGASVVHGAQFYAKGKDGLYVVDPATGKSAYTGFMPLSARTIAHGPTGLIALDGTALLFVDRGGGTIPGVVGAIAATGWLAGTPGELTAVGYGPPAATPLSAVTPVLYGAFKTAAGTYIVIVSPTAATATPVAPLPVPPLVPAGTVNGLAHSPATGMLASVHDPAAPAPAALRVVGLGTGTLGAPVVIKVGGVNVADVAGIAFDSAGTLFALVGQGGGPTVQRADLLTVAAGTGAGTVVGNTRIPNPAGLAWPVGLYALEPTPGAPVIDVNPLVGPPGSVSHVMLERVPGFPAPPPFPIAGPILDMDASPSVALVIVDGAGFIRVHDPKTYALVSSTLLTVAPLTWLPPGGFVKAIEHVGSVLYGIYALPGGGPPGTVPQALVSIDPSSGVMTPVVALPPPLPPALPGPGTALLTTPYPILSLAYEAASGLLIALTGPSALGPANALLKIAPATGDISGAPAAPAPPVPVVAAASPFLPGPGPLEGLFTIEFGADGVLYGAPMGGYSIVGVGVFPGANPIFAISTLTGTATFKGDPSPFFYGAMTLGPRPSFTPPDADGDGLTDIEEIHRGTNLASPDSDGDGLNDGDEVFLHATNPAAADSDGDGFNDGAEVAAGSNPNDPSSKPQVAVPLASPLMTALFAALLLAVAAFAMRHRPV